MDDVIKAFLVSIGFAADESSARQAEERIKRVEDTATKADRSRTKTAGEEAMERARQALKEAGIHNASVSQIMAKRDEMAKADKEHEKRQKEHEARQEKARANAVAGLRSLANVAAATAVAVQGFTVAMAGYATHVAAKLEEMAYASDRTKSSVQDLKVFSQAVSQLGGSAGGALNDLENFAGRLRSNPQGYAAFLKSVGVEARDAQGNIRGAAELYKEFRKNVGERKPYEQQLLYAQEMGVSEQTWRATDPAKLAEEEARSRAKYARLGYDPDKATEDAKGLQHALRDMFESINIIGEKTASKIFADVGDNLKGFTTFIEQHGDQIAEILSKVAQMVLAVSRALLELLTSDKVKGGLDWLMGMFGHVEEGTGKWVADTEKIKAALEALAVFVATVFVAKITGGIREILKELAPLLTLLAPFAGVLGLPAIGTAIVGGALVAGSDPSKGITHGGRPDGALNPGDELPGVGGGSAGSGEGAWARAKRLGRAALNAVGLGGGDADTPRGSGQGNARAARTGEMMRYAMDQLRREGVPEENLKQAAAHLVGQATMESGLDPNKVHDQGTGYGIYGARDPKGWGDYPGARRSQMVKWLEANGYARNSAEGQMREMAHRAMSGKFPQTKAILIGRGTGDVGADTRTITGEFEAPKFINDRTGAVRNALRVGPEKEATAAPTPPGLPKLQDAARAFSERAADGASRLDPGKLKAIGAATEGFKPEDYFKTAPPVGTSTNNDNSVRHQSYNRGDSTVNIYTQADARETHDLWRRHEDRQKADDLRHASNVFAA